MTKHLPERREVDTLISKLRSEVIPRLEPLGSVGGWELVQGAVEVLEAQQQWIDKLEMLARAYWRSGLRPQPTSGEPPADPRNNCMAAAWQYAGNAEDLRAIEKDFLAKMERKNLGEKIQ